MKGYLFFYFIYSLLINALFTDILKLKTLLSVYFDNLYNSLTMSTSRDRIGPSPYSFLCPFALDPFFSTLDPR